MGQFIKPIFEPEALTDRSFGLRAEAEGGCCTQVTMAWFFPTGRTEIVLRHSGPTCAGRTNFIDYRAWRKGRIQPA
jgi:hypothetical protein